LYTIVVFRLLSNKEPPKKVVVEKVVVEKVVIMQCMQCGCIKFQLKLLKFNPSIKKETVEVTVPCFVCLDCQTSQMDNEQLNGLRRAASDAYRQKHNLLTSKEILQYRELLGFSQTSFAEFLNVGEASIKRWETYYIQDNSQDEHIRLKCDEFYAEANLLNLRSRYEKPSVYNGEKTLSIVLFNRVNHRILEKNYVCKKDLNNLHFYIDFLHFKRHGQSITGTKYVPLRIGPTPYQYDLLLTLHNRNFSSSLYKNPALEHLNSDEKETIDHVCQIYKEKGGNNLSDLSNREKAFLETENQFFMTYKFATCLLI